MEIRKARQEDLPIINEIYNQAVRKRFCTAHLEEPGTREREIWFAGHIPASYPVFVAVDDQRVSGWISLGPYRENRQALDHVAEVSYYVDEKEHGKGIGSRLLNHVIHVAPDYGLTVLIAILLNKNPASIGLLQKVGFEEWGRMPEIAKIDGQLADHLYYGLKI
jgi:L-amino acid N-acyltransferase YncA